MSITWNKGRGKRISLPFIVSFLARGSETVDWATRQADELNLGLKN